MKQASYPEILDISDSHVQSHIPIFSLLGETGLAKRIINEVGNCHEPQEDQPSRNCHKMKHQRELPLCINIDEENPRFLQLITKVAKPGELDLERVIHRVEQRS